MSAQQGRKPNPIAGAVAWIATVALLVTIGWTFTRPPPAAIEELHWADPLFHFGAFFGATSLGLIARAGTRIRFPAVAVPIGASIFGAGVEYAQSFSPAHTSTLDDALMNAAGAFVAFALWRGLKLGLALVTARH